MRFFVCTNCGFWQLQFRAPSSCPVCEDFRHTPPAGEYEFRSPEELPVRCCWRQDDAGVTTFWNEPRIGIGPNGYLIRRESGNILFENTVWYSEAALDHISELGGVRWASASHPHAYGAMWQIQERFRPVIFVPKADLAWTNSFRVTYPYDNCVSITDRATLIRSGGHFKGHALLWVEDLSALFAGDMFKLHFEAGRLVGISTHKAFNRKIPLSSAELRRYRKLIGELCFSRAYTTFDVLTEEGVRELALGLFEHRLQEFPSTEPVPVKLLPSGV